MSARRSAGASLTPSPVIATTSPSARSASAMRSFASGETRAKMSSSGSRSTPSSSASLSRPAARPSMTVGRSPTIPTRAGDRRGGQAVVAGDDDDADARPMAARRRRRGPRRAAGPPSRPARGSSGHARPRRASSGPASTGSRPSLGDREHAQAASRVSSVSRAIGGALVASERALAADRSSTVAQRSSTASGAPLACTVAPSWSMRRPSPSASAPGRSGRACRRGVARSARVDAAPSCARRRAVRQLGRVAARRARGRRCVQVAPLQRAASARQTHGCSRVVDPPMVVPSSSIACPAPSRLGVTAHPVLGQRAGLVGADDGRRAERLDGAEALDHRACGARVRCTPTASASVIDGSSPSGTLATISRPIANTTRVRDGRPSTEHRRAGRRPRPTDSDRAR